MVESCFDDQAGTARLVLRPNRSWTWRANLLLLWSLAAVSGSVAVVLSLHGYWLVLLFTVLEQSILFGCLWWCVRQTHRQEVLTLSRDDVLLQAGHARPESTLRWPRFHTRVLVERPRHPWYATRVLLRHHGERVEIGSFLNRADKQTLIQQLHAQIRRLAELPVA